MAYNTIVLSTMTEQMLLTTQQVITLQCRLSFKNERDYKRVLGLMRRWSACMRYAYQRLLEGWKRNELKQHLPFLFKRLKSESNPWKKNRIQAEIRQATIEIERLKRHIKALSPGSGPVLPKETAQGKKSLRGRMKVLQWGWSVLRAATVVPLLERPFVRDFSPLRPLLVSGAGKRAAGWLTPTPGVGVMGVSNTASWGWDTLKGGEQIPQPNRYCAV